MGFNIPFATAGGGSPWVFPTMPVPLTNDGLVLENGEKLPHNGTLIDNVRILDTFVGTYEGFLGTTLVWTVNPTDINALVDGFIGASLACWYDSINDRLYVFGLDSGTAPDTLYTAFITLETGAVTSVGNAQLSADSSDNFNLSKVSVGRDSIDSGNFNLQFLNRTIVINDSTGAEVSNVASTNTTEGNDIGNYRTLDGKISVKGVSQASAGDANLQLTQNKNTVTVPIPDSLFAVVGTGLISVIPWGDKVKLYVGTPTNQEMVRTFLRSDFDEWLTKVANHGGLA